MHRITEVKALPGYRLHLRFADGAEGDVDLSDLAGKGVFAAWRDPANFDVAFVDPESGTVAWPGGVDLDPERLYSEITKAPLPGSTARKTTG